MANEADGTRQIFEIDDDLARCLMALDRARVKANEIGLEGSGVEIHKLQVQAVSFRMLFRKTHIGDMERK